MGQWGPGHTVEYAFDGMSRLTRQENLSAYRYQTRTFKFGGDIDEVSLFSFGSGQLETTTGFAFDTAGRLVERLKSDTQRNLYNYDAAGRVTRRDFADLSQPSGVVLRGASYAYDAAGRTVAETRDNLGVGFTALTLDFPQNRLGPDDFYVNGNQVQSFVRDGLGRSVTATDHTNTSITTHLRYDGLSRLRSEHSPDVPGGTVTFSYPQSDWTTFSEAAYASGEKISYAFFANGLPSTITRENDKMPVPIDLSYQGGELGRRRVLTRKQ